MRAVIQRVVRAGVAANGETVGRIGRGLAVLVGFTDGDGARQTDWMARKIAGLRIFEDEMGKMNLALADVAGQVLVVPNFTLYGDASKGRRPSFTQAAAPEQAEQLLDQFVAALREQGVTVAEGEFGASMQVDILNDGPVTLILDTAALK